MSRVGQIDASGVSTELLTTLWGEVYCIIARNHEYFKSSVDDIFVKLKFFNQTKVTVKENSKINVHK